MCTNYPTFSIDKYNMAPYYKGELCNPLITADIYFLKVLFGYIIASILKICNMHHYSFCEVHLEAMRLNKGV